MPVIQIKIREIAMIKKLILILLSVSACIGIGNKSYALSTGTTSTGVYYEKETKDPTRIIDYIPFDEFSLSTTWGTITGHVGEYASNSVGGSATTDGWVDGRGWKGDRSWEVKLALVDISSGTATIRLVGRDGNKGTGTVILELTKTSAYNETIPVSEAKDWYRIEYNIDTIGTDIFSSRLKLQDGVR